MSEKKTVIVVEHGRERHYDADSWEHSTDPPGYLTVMCKHENAIVAVHAPGAWLSARHSDALVPDGTNRALGIAKRGLTEILGKLRATNTDTFSEATLAELRQLADDTLGEIYAETEL